MAKKTRKVNYASSSDVNRDGRTTRSEAKRTGVDISDPADLNDDGRVTRSERAAYNRAFNRKRRASSRARLKKLTPAKTKKQLRMIFDHMDENDSGAIDVGELINSADLLGFGNLTEFEIISLFNEADTNGDGSMDFDEFQAIVANCRDSSSHWANAGMLETAVKRHNNVLAASDSLFAPLQDMAAAAAETDQGGRKVAGCCRICSGFAVIVLLLLSSVSMMIAVGPGQMREVWDLGQRIDPSNSINPELFFANVVGLFVPPPKDSDGDGIPDSTECPTSNADMSQCTDTDDDGTPDYLDEDSDNDGVPDKVEAQMVVILYKGRPVAKIRILKKPADTDSDGTPDHLDKNTALFASDVMGITQNQDVNKNPAGWTAIDANADGIPDYLAQRTAELYTRDAVAPVAALVEIVKDQFIAFQILGGFYAFVLMVGWSRSQAHLGHVLFGYHVIDMETGEPVGFLTGILPRILLPFALVFAAVSFAPQLLAETVTTIIVLALIVNPLVIMFHPDSRNVYDILLGQQVCVRQ